MVGFLNREVTKVIEKRHPSKESVVDFEDEAQFLDRIREEATLPEFSLFTEYSQVRAFSSSFLESARADSGTSC